MGLKADTDGNMEVVASEATPEELKEMRRQYAELVVANRKVVGDAERDCRDKESELVRRLQSLCKHGAVISTTSIPETRYFWGTVKQKGRTAKALCVLCGKCDDFGSYSPFVRQMLADSDLVRNAFMHKEVSQDEFEGWQRDWMYKAAVFVQVPIGLFK
jgi:hypothetical protein